MPYHGRGMKAQGSALLLEPPAEVDIIAGHPKLRIESADRLQRRLPESHVAAGNVLSGIIG